MLAQDVRELAPGAPVIRELRGSEVHVYRIPMQARQYLRVLVSQRGIEVTLKILGPDQQLLTEVNNQSDPQMPERVSMLSQSPGAFRLEVRPTRNDAATGKYEIKIEEVREADS